VARIDGSGAGNLPQAMMALYGRWTRLVDTAMGSWRLSIYEHVRLTKTFQVFTIWLKRAVGCDLANFPRGGCNSFVTGFCRKSPQTTAFRCKPPQK